MYHVCFPVMFCDLCVRMLTQQMFPSDSTIVSSFIALKGLYRRIPSYLTQEIGTILTRKTRQVFDPLPLFTSVPSAGLKMHQ